MQTLSNQVRTTCGVTPTHLQRRRRHIEVQVRSHVGIGFGKDDNVHNVVARRHLNNSNNTTAASVKLE